MLRTYQLAFLSALLASSSFYAQAGEFVYGKGTFFLQGGLLGLETEISAPVNTYTVKDHHVEILSTNWFYNYHLAYYSAPSLATNGGITPTTLGGDLLLYATGYEFAGLDGQLTLGYDIYKRGTFDYIGFGVSLGIATPYLKNTGIAASGAGQDGSGSSQPVPSGDEGTQTGLIASTTKFFGYKVGPKVLVSKSFGEYASLFAEASYAWQAMNVKNSLINLSADVDGTYFTYGIGMRYQPFSAKKEIGFITLKPALYLTLGVNYARLLLGDLKVDLSGNNYAIDRTKLNMSSTTLYVGFGYAF